MGGGNVGLEKLTFLLKSSPNANVEIVATRFLPEILALAEKHSLTLTKSKFKKKYMDWKEGLAIKRAEKAKKAGLPR